MAHRKYDLVQETSTSTGTGAMALAGAPTRRRTFSSVLANADTAYVLIENASAAEWEICLATYATAGNQLTRGAVLASSTGSTVSFSAGTKTISLIAPASKSVVEDNNGDAQVTRRIGVGGAPLFECDIQGNGNTSVVSRLYNANTGASSKVTFQANAGGRYVNYELDYTGQYMIEIGSGITSRYSDFDLHVWAANAGTEYARLNSTGLGIGRAPGYKLDVAGEFRCGTSGNVNLGNNTNGFLTNSTGDFGIYNPASTAFYIHFNNVQSFAVTNSSTYPGVSDNTNTLGTGSKRWSVVYAGTGTINTSGRDSKVGIRAPSDAERAAARRILDTGPKLYKFKDAVDAKGESARLHAGYIAEDVRDALEAEGLDPWAYGFMCADALTTTETYTETVTRPKVAKVQAEERAVEMVNGRAVMVTRTVERDEPVGRMVPVYGEDGEPVMVPGGAPNAEGEPAMVPMLHFVQDTETVEETRTREVSLLDTEGKPVMRLGLRYSELEAFLKCAAPVAG